MKVTLGLVITKATWISEVHQSVQVSNLFEHVAKFEINHEIIHACIVNVKYSTRYVIEM